MEAWQWGLAVTIVVALVGTVWLLFRAKVERTETRLDDHIKDDIKIHERTAVNESEIERIKKDIGDHESGLRGEQHAQTQVLTQHEVRITMLEKK